MGATPDAMIPPRGLIWIQETSYESALVFSIVNLLPSCQRDKDLSLDSPSLGESAMHARAAALVLVVALSGAATLVGLYPVVS
eukprot:SAG22_NODE_12758_length_430_cov_1.012085_2_plen_82_part_01